MKGYHEFLSSPQTQSTEFLAGPSQYNNNNNNIIISIITMETVYNNRRVKNCKIQIYLILPKFLQIFIEKIQIIKF